MREIMKTVCEKDKCVGCMACIDICGKKAIQIEDTWNAYNAVIDEQRCVNCGQCQRVCQNCNPVTPMKSIQWYQGWATQEDVRKSASSGGVASALSQSFLQNGGVVCSCTFEKGEFVFRTIDNVADVHRFTGSKYVKSNPVGCYSELKRRLLKKQKVLFIGLPCQVAALKQYVGEDLREQLYTVDLICHGTPSPKVLQQFLNQHGYELEQMSDLQFRKKDFFALLQNQKELIGPKVRDAYTISFLNSICYTENCYSCAYARPERVSDISLGDSWGSTLSVEEQKKGISLILCQTEKGVDLISHANLHLQDVDIENAIARNHQLNHPSPKPEKRTYFFEELKKGKRFNGVVFHCYPKQCVKQGIKLVLNRIKK